MRKIKLELAWEAKAGKVRINKSFFVVDKTLSTSVLKNTFQNKNQPVLCQLFQPEFNERYV